MAFVMKKLFVIVITGVLASNAIAQCPSVTNGTMENRQVDSFQSLLDTNYFYALDQEDWHTTMEPMRHGHPDQAKAPENTSSANSYEGNYALKVPENLFILSYGDAFFRDSCSKVANGMGGYYLTDDSVKNFTFKVNVVFSQRPSEYFKKPANFDSTQVNTYEFPPTNGVYTPFNFSFHNATVKKADSMMIYFEWFVDDADYPFNPDFLIDSLHFTCNPPSSIPSDVFKNIHLRQFDNGITLLRTYQTKEYSYQISNLNGQILQSGNFEEEIQFQPFGEFVILQVSYGTETKVFKIPQ